jgi:hypothetical protein
MTTVVVFDFKKIEGLNCSIVPVFESLADLNWRQQALSKKNCMG